MLPNAATGASPIVILILLLPLLLRAGAWRMWDARRRVQLQLCLRGWAQVGVDAMLLAQISAYTCMQKMLGKFTTRDDMRLAQLSVASSNVCAEYETVSEAYQTPDEVALKPLP